MKIIFILGLFLSLEYVVEVTDISITLSYAVTPRKFMGYNDLRGGQAPREKFTIIRFMHSRLKSMSQETEPPNDVTEFCQVPYDCIVYSDLNKYLPISELHNFSAALVGGPGKKRSEVFLRSMGIDVDHRPRGQYWISLDSESAINPGVRSSITPYTQTNINWTATHGDNVTFYFGGTNTEKLKTPTPPHQVENEARKFFNNKTKLVCWAMSNCGLTWTNRNQLAIELIKNMPSDDSFHFFGSGTSCLAQAKGRFVEHGKVAGKQVGLQAEIKDCFFYLSFENSNCSHYITEKFGNGLEGHAVPIVNGWRQSYQELLPGSFIHAKDFPSGKELSEYLQYLSKNFEAHFEYHKWRQSYRINGADQWNTLYCQICRKLKEEKDDGYRRQYIVPDLKKFYTNFQTCKRD